MRNISAWLKHRRARHGNAFPSLHWKPFLWVTASLVLLALLALDTPLGAARMSPAARWFGRGFTDYGKSDWILYACLFVIIQSGVAFRALRRRRERMHALFISHVAFYAFACIALSGISANLLKRLIGRARPVHFDDWGVFGFSPLSFDAKFESFPSGHSTTLGALFMIVALLLPRHRLLWGVIAVWLAATRVMVGAHYPSDVIAGFAYGTWFSLATAIVFSRYGLVFRLSAEGWPIPRQKLTFSRRINA